MGIQPQFRRLLRNAFCPGEGARDNSCSSAGGGGASDHGGGDHPMVIGKADLGGSSAEKAFSIKFDGKEYTETGKKGRSFHDNTKLRAFEDDDGHRVWLDGSGRVHADSKSEAKARTTRNSYSTLLINAGAARREVVNGREYLVAPMTIIVPGVLNGSRGALLYPPSEVAREPGMWNGVPIVRNHPTENGQHVSGRTPHAMSKYWMGHVFNDRWDGSKRTAEGWFDVEATKRVDPAIHNRLERGDKIELSTGLFTDNQDRRGNWKGKPYDAIAYNYRPDHLAILPDQRGACSVEDGCGVMVNQTRNAFCPGEGARDNSCSSSGGATSESGLIRGEIAASVLKLDAKPTQSSRDWWNSLAPTERSAVLTLVKSPEGAKRQKQFDELKSKLHDYDKNFTHQSRIDEAYRAVRDRRPTGNQDDSQSGPEKRCKCGGTCGECAEEVSPEPIAKNAFCPGEGARDNSCSSSGGGGLGDGGKVIPAEKLTDDDLNYLFHEPGTPEHDFSARSVKESKKAAREAGVKAAQAKAAHETQQKLKQIHEDAKKAVAGKTLFGRAKRLFGFNAFAPRHASDPRSARGQFKTFGSGTGKGATHEAAQAGALLFHDADRANAQRSVSGDHSWAADQGKLERAKAEAEKGFGSADDAVYWAAASSIYRRMGGAVTNAFRPVRTRKKGR